MSQDKKLSEEQRTAAIQIIKECLNGTFMVDDERCRKCGKHVLVKYRNLERVFGSDRIAMGIIVDAHVAMCIGPDSCGYVAARRVHDTSGRWLCGRAEVEFVDGDPFVVARVPQKFTALQRERMETELRTLEAQ